MGGYYTRAQITVLVGTIAGGVTLMSLVARPLPRAIRRIAVICILAGIALSSVCQWALWGGPPVGLSLWTTSFLARAAPVMGLALGITFHAAASANEACPAVRPSSVQP
jgi:hypothetical protein